MSTRDVTVIFGVKRSEKSRHLMSGQVVQLSSQNLSKSKQVFVSTARTPFFSLMFGTRNRSSALVLPYHVF